MPKPVERTVKVTFLNEKEFNEEEFYDDVAKFIAGVIYNERKKENERS